MPVAPSAPRAAHRRASLTTVPRFRRRAAVLLAVVVSSTACSSGPDGPEVVVLPEESATTVTPAPVPTDELGDPSPKPEPARDAGPVDAPAGVSPEGFDTVSVRVTAADGTECDVCLWLAATSEERNRGLMGVTDLGEPVGMLFAWDERVESNFFMFATPMPLSIAWFDTTGDGTSAAHVGQTEMEPCLVGASADCERYGPGAPYQLAVEMVSGELDVIGIGPGSTIEILARHDTCPAA